MQVFARLDRDCTLGDTPSIVRRLDSLGFDGLHVSETTHDPFVVAAIALTSSSRLLVRTSVALAFVRSPLVTAYSAWDLMKLSGGRFHLGLGTQIRQNIEDRYGMPWRSPIERMTEYVDFLECAFAAFRTGTLVPYEGQHYQLRRLQPPFNPGPDSETNPPQIWLGGVNRKICELAGARAQGFMTHSTNSHPRYIEAHCLPSLAVGAKRAGRAERSVPVFAGSCFITGRDRRQIATEQERQRQKLAFLFSTPAYRPTLDLCGFAEVQEQLQAMARQRNWDGLQSVVTDELLNEVLPSATYDELPSLVHARLSGIVNGFVLPPPADPSDDTAFARVLSAIKGTD